jgi:hypothetical protein
LAEREGIVLSARTLRRILGEAGLPAVRTRRSRGHRTRREPMSQAGLLLQVDGSRHDWLEGRGPWLTLVGGIDDATGIVTGAIFREQEDTAGELVVLTQRALHDGLPVSLYFDCHGIFWKGRQTVPTLAEQFAGRRSTTQFGRALEVAGIAARGSFAPGQGPGRASLGTRQDRLTSELRRAEATSFEEANQVLARHVARRNVRFAVPARDSQPAWRPLDQPVETIFCFPHVRRLAGDGTLTLDGRSLMVVGPRPGPTGPRSVVVQQRLDGTLWVDLDRLILPLVPAPERPVVLRATPSNPQRPNKPIPPRDHPWRRYPLIRPK